MIGGTTIKIDKIVRKQKPILKRIIVNHIFQEKIIFVANKLHRPQLLKQCRSKNLPDISSDKLQE